MSGGDGAEFGKPDGVRPAAAPGSRRAMRAAASHSGQPAAAADDSAPAGDPASRTTPPLTRTPYGIEPPTSDVSPVTGDGRLPGAHRGGFARLPTEPIGITLQSAPGEPGTEPVVQWGASPSPPRGFAAGALIFAVLGLVVALFVGWGFPLGIVAIVLAVVALRRPLESRGLAVWAIVLGAVSIVYSIGWLVYAASFI